MVKIFKKYDMDLLKLVIQRDEITVDIEKIKKISSLVRVDFICKCGNTGNKTFRLMFEKGSLCRSCTIKLYNIRHKASLLENTGCEYPLQSEKAKQKKRETCIERFGVENQLQCEAIKEKRKKTCLIRYNCEHVFQAKIIREKIINSYIKHYGVSNPLQSEIIKIQSKKTCLKKYGFLYSSQSIIPKQKMIDTNIKRYGVSSVMKLQIFKDKRNNTNIKKYGVSSVMKLQIFKDKRNNTNIKRYGVSSSIKLQYFKNKREQTCLKKYGVKHVAQAKIPFKSFQYKKYIYPCGIIVQVQGYEPFALNDLIKEGYVSLDIITCRSKVPDIWYNDNNGKSHRYFVDIYIPKINKMIEVKSEYTLNKYKENVLLKANECVKQGYDYEIWIYDYNGNRKIKNTFND
jgi:hypothetical protein